MPVRPEQYDMDSVNTLIRETGEIISPQMSAYIYELSRRGCTVQCIPCHVLEVFHRELDQDSISALLEHQTEYTFRPIPNGETLLADGRTRMPNGIIQQIVRLASIAGPEFIAVYLNLRYPAHVLQPLFTEELIETVLTETIPLWTTGPDGDPIPNPSLTRPYVPSGHHIGDLPTEPLTPRNDGRPRSSHRTPPPTYSPTLSGGHPRQVLAPLALLERPRVSTPPPVYQDPPSYEEGQPQVDPGPTQQRHPARRPPNIVTDRNIVQAPPFRWPSQIFGSPLVPDIDQEQGSLPPSLTEEDFELEWSSPGPSPTWVPRSRLSSVPTFPGDHMRSSNPTDEVNGGSAQEPSSLQLLSPVDIGSPLSSRSSASVEYLRMRLSIDVNRGYLQEALFQPQDRTSLASSSDSLPSTDETFDAFLEVFHPDLYHRMREARREWIRSLYRRLIPLESPSSTDLPPSTDSPSSTDPPPSTDSPSSTDSSPSTDSPPSTAESCGAFLQRCHPDLVRRLNETWRELQTSEEASDALDPNGVSSSLDSRHSKAEILCAYLRRRHPDLMERLRDARRAWETTDEESSDSSGVPFDA